MYEDERRLLRRLLDEQDIRGVLLRYCRGVDRCDEDLIASCFHPDARDDHGNWLAQGPMIAPHIVATVKIGTGRATHFLGNIIVELDGDTAFAESYVMAFRSFERDGEPFTRVRSVRFVDRFERRESRWRISERLVVDDWSRVDKVVEVHDESGGFWKGSKDQSDPVYAIRLGSLARVSR